MSTNVLTSSYLKRKQPIILFLFLIRYLIFHVFNFSLGPTTNA